MTIQIQKLIGKQHRDMRLQLDETINYTYKTLFNAYRSFMRTTLDLPVLLLNQAIRVSNQRTKTAVIIEALEDFIRKHKIQGLKKYKGKVNLDMDLNVLRNRK